MRNDSPLTKTDILNAASARVTDSNLDQLVQGHFATLELHNDLDLIEGLNTAKNWLIDNREKLNTRKYDPNIDALEVEHKLSEPHLRVIQDEDAHRFVAGQDANQIKFGNVRFSDLTQTLAVTLEKLLKPRRVMRLFQSGRNWYPPNGYMGWHTNANVQGFRLYCNHTPVAQRSYFRYLDPFTSQIETSWDSAGWNFRCFRTDLEPLWHCVYSQTDRISFGYGLMFPIDTGEGVRTEALPEFLIKPPC